MTQTLIANTKLIRTMISQSLQSSGKLLAVLEEQDCSPDKTARTLEQMMANMENAVIAMRNMCEHDCPNEISKLGKPALPDISIAGRAEINNYGWLHIELNTLLPNCRFQTPHYLKDTIIRLLDDYEDTARQLPRFEEAILVIDEHCNISSRTVYDQDNKGWKAIPNAIKGRIVKDDDQFTLELALLSTVSDKPSCHIYILPKADAGEFFLLRSDDLLR